MILSILHDFNPILFYFYVILHDKYMLTSKIIYFYKSTHNFNNFISIYIPIKHSFIYIFFSSIIFCAFSLRGNENNPRNFQKNMNIIEWLFDSEQTW
jgi:hypothetical protein